MLRKLISLWARPRVLPEDAQTRLPAVSHVLVYVIETRGIADKVVVEQVCEKLNLPRRHGALAGAKAGEFPLLYLERRRGFFGNRIDRRLPEPLRHLVRTAQSNPALDVALVPVSVFWGRAPAKEDSWLRLWLAETWDLTGRFRRLLSVLFNGRNNLLVQFGDPIPLRTVLADGVETARVIRRVARRLRSELSSQRAATIGPDLSHRRTIVTQVLRTRAVRQAMVGEMKAKNLSRRAAITQAKTYADEIAANYSAGVVNIFARLLARVWNRLYDGVELNHLEKLHDVVEGNELIYVPCHRSHMDYLLLSYSVYMKGFTAPHIAAGINLNMPIVGSLLRRCGAFFLRRSFAGNSLYAMVFMKYLGLMMARGHSIEYFIEGGRSRTGRLLQPKTGMLSMTVRSFLRDPRKPLVFVPIYFGYERLVEGKTYINELSGKAKEKESVLGMVKAIPALRSRYGKVHVSIGAPIYLNQVLSVHAPDWQSGSYDNDDRPAWLNRAVDELATRIMTNINAAACVTPVNLLALALLATPKQAMIETDLARQMELYAAMLRRAPYSPDVVVTSMDGASMIKYCETLNLLERRKHAMGDVLQMSEENSVLLTYFRNNVLHLIVLPSVIACCFLNNRSMRTEDVQRLAWRIYPYVRDELFLRWTEDELADAVRATLEHLANLGLVEMSASGSEWLRPATGTAEAVQLSLLAQVTVPIIERYYLTIALLLKSGSGRISQDALENQCQLMAQRMSLIYELNSPEFFDKALFKNFIDLLRSRNVLGVNAEGRLTYTELLLAVSSDAQLVLHEQIRNSILQVTHV
ncbi:MAG TPA: glycerol-3-phosphate 1-O-acyltransferase PlsB [Steroidobacteraceae bacterium]|nr:glycerol-3-phosphate 1-O-acyltransferase PlsB [Steroidobacteraceae bacterium]